MKLIISILIAVAIIQTVAQDQLQRQVDLTGIPMEELKALQQAVNFKQAKAQEQADELKSPGGFFERLFGDKSSQNNRIRFSRRNDDADGEQSPFQPQGLNQLLGGLPYEALLPRRRQPVGLLNKLLQGEEKSQEQSEKNPLAELDELLSNRRAKKQGKSFHWQNPDFKEGKRSIPYSKIFGAKSKKRHNVNVNEQDIQKLLVKSMPSLSEGRILKLSSVPYRKGIFLNIEYETTKQQIYTIKAKYLKKANELEIISMTEINVLRRVEDDVNESDDQETQANDVKAKDAVVEVQPKVVTSKVDVKEEKTQKKEELVVMPDTANEQIGEKKQQTTEKHQKAEEVIQEKKTQAPEITKEEQKIKKVEAQISKQQQSNKEIIKEEPKPKETIQNVKSEKEQPQKVQESSKTVKKGENEDKQNSDDLQSEQLQVDQKEREETKASEPKKSVSEQKPSKQKAEPNLSKQAEEPGAIVSN